MKPYFSIVIPLYNKEKHIVNTLESVLAQAFRDYEVIIVNDGSTDTSKTEANSIKDKRIKLYTINNGGVSAARNYGISKANSDLVAFLDADDYWYPNHLKILMELYIKFPNCGLYATAYSKQYKNITLESFYKNIPFTKNWMGIVTDFFESSSVNCIAWTSAIMVPKQILETLEGFKETITLGAGEDTDLWIRIALKYSVAFSNIKTAIHNLDSKNRISNSNTDLRKFIDLNIYENEAKHNPSLKKFIDLNRYSIAIQYKLVGNKKMALFYSEKINLNNLKPKQRFLLQTNPIVLKLLLKLKLLLRSLGLNLSSFK